jgi:small subunit ribosomal protein S4
VGDPKFSRRAYSSPSHPWVGERIKAENGLLRKYGLKNKREIWKAAGKLRAWRTQARELQARLQKLEKQAEKERDLLIGKLTRMGLLGESATLDDILAMDLELILARRFQSQVFLKGLSKTTRHARQLISQGHLAIGGRKVTVPGYILRRGEEEQIAYYGLSPMNSPTHAMRPPAEFRGVLEEIRLEEEDQRQGFRGRRIKVHVPVPEDQADETVGAATPEEKTKDIVELTPEVPAEDADLKEGEAKPAGPAEPAKPPKADERPKKPKKEG